MAELPSKLRIFVASPSDCRAEREAIYSLVRTTSSNLTLARHLEVSIDVYGWEDVFPDVGRPQSLINEAIAKFNPNWFVFIFWSRFGTDAGLGMTGTEEEWSLALGQKNSNPELSVTAYFNTAPINSFEIDDTQQRGVEEYRRRIFSNYSALASNFDGTRDFKEKFQSHLIDKLFSLSHTQGGKTEDLALRLHNVSGGLISWSSTIDGRQIERPQLELILKKIQDQEHSATIVLGQPGSGKSALLAMLARILETKRIPFLAIKADQLGSSIESVEELREWLGLPISLRDAILTLAKSDRAVVIVDQLDAVSELLDRKSGRLNTLMNLMHSLSGRHNVHIVTSSREFEYRHDARLSSINAERLDLELPSWTQVSEVLLDRSVQLGNIGDPLKDLLLLPFNLKIYLDVGTTNATFESHYSLLEELWTQRVLFSGEAVAREALLELLAERMSRDETLWLPTAVADGDPSARQALEQADILTRGSNGLTIGFRHQTLYDFTTCRAYARGTRSLSTEVIERQDGLFVRPLLISGLNYLRATARSEYHKQVSVLMGSQVRLHIKELVVEILGGQSDPDNSEARIMIALLDSEADRPRVLRAVAYSLGWFSRFKRHPAFTKLLLEAPDKAVHCVPLIASVVGHEPAACLELIEKFWIGDQAYDSLSLAVLQENKDWNRHSVDVVCTIARRTQAQWAIEYVAEKVAESAPAEAPCIIRADFDRQLSLAVQESEKPVPELPPDADQQQRMIHEMTYEPRRPIKQLMESSQNWDNLEEFALRAPKAFLDDLWPWFVNVVTQTAKEDHALVVSYRDDPISYRSFEGTLEPPPIIRALLTAIVELARKHKANFLTFLDENKDSEFLSVHRMLVRGLAKVATELPEKCLEYLSSDPRRLVIGDAYDRLKESKQLITELAGCLDPAGVQELERVIRQHNRYIRISREWPAQLRFERRKRDREERLELLRAIPIELSSEATRKFRAEEELAFPESQPTRTADVDGVANIIGSRMTAAEMALASDDELINLFEKLPDSSGWDNPKLLWSEEPSRAGGAIQCSREFGLLAKQLPARVLSLASRLRPGSHEQYAGEALTGLASTDLPVSNVISLLEELDDKGFHSTMFRDDAARACDALAARNHGLPDSLLARLTTWVDELKDPMWPEAQDDKDKPEKERTNSILYGHSLTTTLSHARGGVTRAIAEGCLRRNPIGINEWAQFIEKRLGAEKHPKIWSEILIRMPILSRDDHRVATEFFDRVIATCPEVLRYPTGLMGIARVLNVLDPRNVGEQWLDKLLEDGSLFCQQAYGELLPLFNCIYQDAESTERLTKLLNCERNAQIDLGLAYAAIHMWGADRHRARVVRIFRTVAGSSKEPVQRAVASLFRLNRDRFDLDVHMREVIEIVCCNPPVLLFAAEELIQLFEPITAAEPELVSKVCGLIVELGREQIHRPGASWVLSADILTNIALTLHRQDAFRDAGLQLFEQLIALNIREAKDAIEILDRRPVVANPRHPRTRWRRRPRRGRN